MGLHYKATKLLDWLQYRLSSSMFCYFGALYLMKPICIWLNLIIIPDLCLIKRKSLKCVHSNNQIIASGSLFCGAAAWWNQILSLCEETPGWFVYNTNVQSPLAGAKQAEGVPHPFRHHIPPDARFQRKHQKVAEASESRRKHWKVFLLKV